MRRPTSWVLRPRRTTSTSGSSGTGPGGIGVIRGGRYRRGAVQRPIAVDGPAVQAGVGGGRGVLLSLFLRPTGAGTMRQPAQDHLGSKELRVVRTLLADPVLGHAEAAFRGQFLQ